MTAAATTWPNLISALLRGETLSSDETAWAMGELMSGEATGAQFAGFAIALRAKGETAEEVAGLVRVMLANAAPLSVSRPTVDTCGTGGDRSNTVNISTMAALVVAGAGRVVAKHGNRAASSASGSADVLEALGVVVDLPPAAVGTCIETAGIGFCFAPVFHASMRHVGPSRAQLGVPTVFNFLGPLTNPARPVAQAVGCPDVRMAPVMAAVLAARGTSALVVRGDDGLDELSTATTSRVWEVRDGEIREDTVDPERLGIALSPRDALRGGDAAFNADVARRLVDGKQGPVRDAVLLNAAAALVASSPTGGGSLNERLQAGLDEAAASLDGGAAATALERWASTSQSLKPSPAA
ncbi:MAG: anthranilate phosphoribosyltransferase [Frankiaceae bacterium]|jgi:anthranilate phosphoribosyltransferase|nr:anthranilate phosphoribosyltransferase [Frankiaceae bacterium]